MAEGGPYQQPRTLPPLPPLSDNSGMPADVQDPGFDPISGLPRMMSQDVVPSSNVPAGPAAPASVGATPAAGASPAQPAAPTSATGVRTGRKFGVQPGSFAWALNSNDFYPAGSRPNETRSTQVGKYGGAPLFANALEFPDAVIASRMQSLAQERKQLEAAWKQFDPMAGVEDVNAPEYRDSFNRGVMGDIQHYIDSTKQMWGEEDAAKRLQNGSTQEAMGLRQLGHDWTTVSRSINQATKSADAIVEGMSTGTLEYDQDLFDKAKSVRHKLGTYAGQHDARTLARELPNLTANAAFYDQLKKDGIDQVLKDGGSVQDIVEKVKKGDLKSPGFITFLNKKTHDRAALVDSLTDYYARQYHDLSREEVHHRIEAMAPYEYSEKITAKAIPQGKGKGSAPSDAQRYALDNTALPQQLEAMENVPAGQEVRYPTINLMGFSNKEGKTAVPQTYRDGDEEVYMHPERLMNLNGNVVIVGKETGMPRTPAEKAKAAKDSGLSIDEINRLVGVVDSDPTSGESQDAIQRFGVLRPRAVPYDENKALLATSLGFEEGKALSALRSAPQPQATARKEQGYSIKGTAYTLKQLTDMGYTPEQVAPYISK